MTEAGKLKIAVIPGDGIGTEVTAEALKVLKAAIGEFDTTESVSYTHLTLPTTPYV